MLSSWMLVLISVGYVGGLFFIASHGDKRERQAKPLPRPLIYALSLGIYCTSWTFFGSVGFAAQSGFDFLPIYIGPILVVAFGHKLIEAIVRIAKRQNITSIADFISARYGKNQLLGAMVAIIATIGVIPYIALQLKAVSGAVQSMMELSGQRPGSNNELAIGVTFAMAAFAWAFGTRHADATEHQRGLMLAVAAESIVKLIAFLLVGFAVTFFIMDGPSAMWAALEAQPEVLDIFKSAPDPMLWITMTLLSMSAILLLPRQFHVMVVEQRGHDDIRLARFLFPAYLILINLFVVPVAVAGLLIFGNAQNADSFMLAIPAAQGSHFITIIAYIGGLSAATAMVIVETVALSIMISNNVILPIIVRRRAREEAWENMGHALIRFRRLSILAVLGLAFIYSETLANKAGLAQIGLLSFAAIAQFAPAFLIGLFWRRGTALGAMAGIFVGFVIWSYTLILPSMAAAGLAEPGIASMGPYGIGWLKPEALFGLELDRLTHGVLWSLAANLIAFVLVSLWQKPNALERAQASLFISPENPAISGPNFWLWRTSIRLSEIADTVARYLGPERTEQAFADFAAGRGQVFKREAEADGRALRFAENLLASAVGAASSRLIMGLVIEKHSKSARKSVRLLDEASAAIQYNRDLLQSAIDNVRQGIAVFDGNLSLICWNRQYLDLIGLPDEFGRVGVPLHEVVRLLLLEAGTSAADLEANVVDRIERIAVSHQRWRERSANGVLEVGASPMPDGGVVVTFTDVTEAAQAAEELEQRVQARTAELTALNHELAQAKVEAEEANIGKTRFIAAASHDILQPLNAARLFTSSLVEKLSQSGEGELARNVDLSLESMEDILNALLDMSRLDAGAMRTDIGDFRIDELLGQLHSENLAAAQAKGLKIKLVAPSLAVRSDKRMLRRMLQNLISNAIKYTEKGGVLIGARRRGNQLSIEVHDTGFGIPQAKQRSVFVEFERLHSAQAQPGLGLGLSIVERMAQVLGMRIQLKSIEGRGSSFMMQVPLARIQPLKTSLAAKAHVSLPRVFARQQLLVVDNEQAILAAMRSLLEGWGFEVITASNAADAVRAITEHASSVSIILADYHLHQDDGIILVESLRRRAGRHIPALLITADRSPSVQELAQQQDMIYLRKPVKPAALRAALTHALARVEGTRTFVH